jgi:hypothetical protein
MAPSTKDTYRRSTSLEFLDRCPAPVAAFYRYWDSKRAGRAMPSRADLDLADMKKKEAAPDRLVANRSLIVEARSRR